MEKVDILFIGFAIYVFIASCYIAYLKTGINFLCETLAKHQVVMDEFVSLMERQVNINNGQIEINKIISKRLNIDDINLNNSSTGGKKQSN